MPTVFDMGGTDEFAPIITASGLAGLFCTILVFVRFMFGVPLLLFAAGVFKCYVTWLTCMV